MHSRTTTTPFPNKKSLVSTMATFLLKLNCELYFNGAEPRPTDASQWEGATVTALPSRLLDGGAGSRIQMGDSLIIWTHEDVAWGKGQGLTATATVGNVVDSGPDMNVEMRDVKLVKPHVRLERLTGGPTGSHLLDYLRSHRHRRTIEVSALHIKEFWQTIEDLERKRQELIASYSLAPETDAKKALEADRETIKEGFERRFSRVEARPEQSAFRNALMRLYGGRCVVTRVSVPAVLAAAHIIPFSQDVEFRNHVGNGLVLRSDIHMLFDRALIAFKSPTGEIVIAPSLKGTLYEKFAGRVITHWAKAEFLDRHFDEFLARSAR